MISRAHSISALSLRQRICNRTTPRRFSTTAAADSTNSTTRLVVSRRAWNALKAELPPKPKPAAAPKVDDKPWPKSVQIAGYVGGGLLVPYFALWTITSNPTLREWLGPYLPLDKLRTHFGTLEWDAQSYVDEMHFPYDQNKVQSDDVVFVERPIETVQYYQFPEELGFQERQQQQMVEEMEQQDVKITVHVYENSNGVPQSLQDTVKTIPASTLATAQNLLALVKGAVQTTKASTTTVAVDFENDDDSMGDSSDVITMEDTVVSDASTSPTTPSSALLHKTQIFSSWFYVSPAQQQQQQQAQDDESNNTSDTEMTISRLEYQIEELQRSLKDPTCTRDMDEMADELRSAKKELSSLKWKRRLGWT